MGKYTISMAIFNSYVKLPEDIELLDFKTLNQGENHVSPICWSFFKMAVFSMAPTDTNIKYGHGSHAGGATNGV